MQNTKNIKLTNLLVNTENYRFEPIESQKEAIDKMVDDQNNKLFKLAEHIIANGLNPNDRIQVALSNHDKTKYIVLEGNRRVVVLKIMNNPDIIDDKNFSSLKKKFSTLRKNNLKKIIKEIECIVYDDPAEADKWIELKHFGQSEGIGTISWDAQQVDRFQEKVKGKSSIGLQALKLLKSSPNVPPEIKENLGKVKITNLNRLLSDPEIRNFLGIDVNKGLIQSNIDKEEVLKGLTQIIRELLKSSFKVKKIYTKDDRKDFIKEIPKSSKPDTKNKIVQTWGFDNTTSSSSETKKSAKKEISVQHRKKLIPKPCKLRINTPRVNNIYKELQQIDVTKYPNAVAVLFRVFVELSLDCYLEKHNISKTPSAAKSEFKLHQKVKQVVGRLKHNKKIDDAIAKGINTAVKDSHNILGIDTWHAYVHNNRFSPDPSALIRTWDNQVTWGRATVTY